MPTIIRRDRASRPCAVPRDPCRWPLLAGRGHEPEHLEPDFERDDSADRRCAGALVVAAA